MAIISHYQFCLGYRGINFFCVKNRIYFQWHVISVQLDFTKCNFNVYKFQVLQDNEYGCEIKYYDHWWSGVKYSHLNMCVLEH